MPLGGPKNGFFDVKCCGPLFKNVLPATARSTFLQIIVIFKYLFIKNQPEQAGRTRKWVGVGGPSGLIGPKIKLYSFFQRIFKIRWSKAASADLACGRRGADEGVRALAIRGFEPLIFRDRRSQITRACGHKGRGPIWATAASADLLHWATRRLSLVACCQSP